MPRIKAITTGSIPSFLDAILNFAESDKSASLENQDTWLAQLQAKRDGRLVLYGDDTWLKLFPTSFSRADGTSSFFVSDFTEVDNNVTRNVPAELAREDWNGMILHYLGLDHIGHKSGPNSPFMIPKQAEMDNVVNNIYRALENERHLQDTVLVLCGDHGMNDAGNHGGSTEGETSTALVFISPKLRQITGRQDNPIQNVVGTDHHYKRVKQSDIVPTLSMLLGIPIPKNNLGIYITDFLPFWNEDDRHRIAEQNAAQFLGLVKETFPSVSFDDDLSLDACMEPSGDGLHLACLWSRASSWSAEDGDARSRQDVNGTTLEANTWVHALAATLLATMRVIRAWNQTGQKHAGKPDIGRGVLSSHNHLLWALVCVAYFALPGIMLYQSQPQFGVLAAFAFTSILCIGGLTFKIAYTMADAPELLKGLPIIQNRVFATENLTIQARALFLGMMLFCAANFFYSRQRFTPKRPHDHNAKESRQSLHASNGNMFRDLTPLRGILTLFLMTQSRVTNVPLFALFELQMQAFASMDLSAAEISLTAIILQYVSFFAFGGSNSISSIDLSNSYNGVSGYNAVLVGALTFCSNWAGPIWWTFATMLLLTQCRREVYNHHRRRLGDPEITFFTKSGEVRKDAISAFYQIILESLYSPSKDV
ncbi:MAG: hypothetical protein Q9219_006213 [cf. Caloplaca sp. 3 TL-2023]